MTQQALRTIACSVLIAAMATSGASAVELDELLANFDRVQKDIRTLSAEFTETTQNVLLIEPIVAKGRLYLTKPDSVRWEYTAPDRESFFADFISGAHRLPNGNTFVCSGPRGRFFEVTANGETVWEYQNPYTGNAPNPHGQRYHSGEHRQLLTVCGWGDCGQQPESGGWRREPGGRGAGEAVHGGGGFA